MKVSLGAVFWYSRPAAPWWLTDSHLLPRPPASPPLLHLVVISYPTFFYSWQWHRGRSTRLLLITAASRNQTSTTCFARDSGHWTAFESWPARREPLNIGHKNLITGCTFSKLVTGLKPVYWLTLNKPNYKYHITQLQQQKILLGAVIVVLQTIEIT